MLSQIIPVIKLCQVIKFYNKLLIDNKYYTPSIIYPDIIYEDGVYLISSIPGYYTIQKTYRKGFMKRQHTDNIAVFSKIDNNYQTNIDDQELQIIQRKLESRIKSLNSVLETT
jgi:hypothetical protein